MFIVRVTYYSCRVESYYLISYVTTMAPMANGWYVECMVTHSPELSDVQLGLGVCDTGVSLFRSLKDPRDDLEDETISCRASGRTRYRQTEL